MHEFILSAIALIIVFNFRPRHDGPVGDVSLGVAVLFGAPLGWLMTHLSVAPFGWMLLAFSAWVFWCWLREKWQAQ